MNLNEYYEALSALIKQHPEALEMEVVTSIDEEGNGWNPVFYKPAMGKYENGDFYPLENEHANAVSLN